MISQLRHANFDKVYQVKDSIVDRGKEIIPQLIILLEDTSFIKLENTADLIYPGAEKFYGHGWAVPYDIDWISVRSAWLLEEITFQNFGYLNLPLNEGKITQLHDKVSRQDLITYRKSLADSVTKWWDKNKSTWTRFNALKEALSSNNIQRQNFALYYLRFDKTNCEDLTADKYNTELKPLVEKIKSRKSEGSEQAQYLLDDKEYHWLKIKQKKSGS